MRSRLTLAIAIAVIAVLAIGVMAPFARVQASVPNQAAATDTPTATATTAAATATATTVAATATSTTAAATATSTTVAATATATATGIPLAAYPAPVLSVGAVRQGHSLVFRWSLITQKSVKGFNLYAAKHKLNSRLIPTHTSLSYHKTVPYRPGRPSLRVMLRNGRYVSVPIL